MKEAQLKIKICWQKQRRRRAVKHPNQRINFRKWPDTYLWRPRTTTTLRLLAANNLQKVQHEDQYIRKGSYENQQNVKATYIQIDNTKAKRVEYFKYLGGNLTELATKR